jgi:hypothetical protein
MFSDQLTNDLNTALNEATVVGVDLDQAAATARLLLHVLALPEQGPIDPDPRRAMTLTGVSDFQLLLRHDPCGGEFGPAIPVADLKELVSLFAQLDRFEPMYGWRFVDDLDLTGDWPPQPSLTLRLRPDPAAHSLYWFTECAQDEDSFCLEGVIRFDGLRVERADATPVTVEQFAADGRRWWTGLHANDPRVSGEAQIAAGNGPRWR